MDRLPDAVLLRVFRSLDDEKLLDIRRVCRRFKDLALHPSLWQQRTIGAHWWNDELSSVDFPRGRCRECAVLRLAPCARIWTVSLPRPTPQSQQLCASTRCAVTKVVLRVRRAGAATAGHHAALLLRNQEALGRLRTLELDSFDSRLAARDAGELIATLMCASGLEQLTLWSFPSALRSLPVPYKDLPAAPSLKLFRCDLTRASQAFCDSILATHAGTLEEAQLGFKAAPPTPATTAALLGAIPGLRVLFCYMMPGLEALAASASLVDLTLTVEVGQQFEARMRSAAALLRGAPQLRRVYLDYGPGTSAPADVDLVAAMAANKRAPLRSLKLADRGKVDRWQFPQLPRLLAALPQLPQLQMLEVSWVPNEFLLALTPQTAPALRSLFVRSWAPCVHNYLHADAVQKCLAANPSLELYVFPCKPSSRVMLPKQCPRKRLCAACSLDCHQDFRKKDEAQDYKAMSEEEQRWRRWTSGHVLLPR